MNTGLVRVANWTAGNNRPPSRWSNSCSEHRNVIREDVALELGQPPVNPLVLDMEPVIPAMSRQASIAQQGSHEHRLLPASEIRSRTSLGVIPHPPIVVILYDTGRSPI